MNVKNELKIPLRPLSIDDLAIAGNFRAGNAEQINLNEPLTNNDLSVMLGVGFTGYQKTDAQGIARGDIKQLIPKIGSSSSYMQGYSILVLGDVADENGNVHNGIFSYEKHSLTKLADLASGVQQSIGGKIGHKNIQRAKTLVVVYRGADVPDSVTAASKRKGDEVGAEGDRWRYLTDSYVELGQRVANMHIKGQSLPNPVGVFATTLYRQDFQQILKDKLPLGENALPMAVIALGYAKGN